MLAVIVQTCNKIAVGTVIIHLLFEGTLAIVSQGYTYSHNSLTLNYFACATPENSKG